MGIKQNDSIKVKLIFLIVGLAIYESYDIINSSFVYIMRRLWGKDINLDVYLIDSIANFFLMVLYFAMFVMWIRHIREDSKVQTLYKNKPYKWLEYFIIAIGLGGIPSAWFLAVDSFLYKIGFIGASYKKMMAASADMDDSPFVFVVLSVVIISPIVEELLFRGLLYNICNKITGRVWISILVSSVLFGVWHGILVQGVYAAILGVIFAVIYYKTDDLRIPIGLHIINNFISTVFSAPRFETLYFYIGILQLVMVLPCIYMVYRIYREG